MIRGLATFVPFHRTALRTSMSPEDVRASLARNTSEPEWWHVRDRTIFRGRVESRSFEVRRFIRYRNSFLPIVLGTIESADTGTVVRLRLRMPAVATGFMSLWMCVALLPTLFEAARMQIPSGLTVLLMPMLGASLVGVAFRYEANVAIETLRTLWNAIETDDLA